jgi:protein CpxP
MENQDRINSKSEKRRGWFKRLGTWAAVAALAGGAALHAHAHGHRGHGGHGFGPGLFGGPVEGPQAEARFERMLQHFYVEVKATPEQQQRLAPIVKQAIADLAPLRKAMRSTRERAREIMTAPQVDRAALEELRSTRMQNADALSRRMTQALADIADVLTPEQRKTMAERMQHRRGGRHGAPRG